MAEQKLDSAPLKGLAHRRVFMVLIVFTLASILIWIGLSIYFSLNKTSLPPNVQKQLQPLSPVLDTKTLETLKTRRIYTSEELAAFDIVRELAPDANGKTTATQQSKVLEVPGTKIQTSTSSATSTASTSASFSFSPSESATP
jgi:hypothetical protein